MANAKTRMQMLRIGNRGPAVTALQGRLKRSAPDFSADGTFGPRTESVVRLARRRLSLFKPDGIAGPRTLATLQQTVRSAQPGNSGGIAATGSALVARVEAEAAIVGVVQQYLAGPAAVPVAIRKPIVAALKHAEQGAMPAGVATPVGGMRLSAQGRLFIIRRGATRRQQSPASPKHGE